MCYGDLLDAIGLWLSYHIKPCNMQVYQNKNTRQIIPETCTFGFPTYPVVSQSDGRAGFNLDGKDANLLMI